MKSNIFKNIIILLAIAVFSSSCIKDKVTALGNTGTARVRLGETPTSIKYFSPFTDTKNVDLITVRRDDVSQAGDNQTVTVTLVNIPDSIVAYNDAKGSSFETLPDSLYTLIGGHGVEKNGDGFKVTFAPGVSAVTISVTLDGSKWDVSHTYAFYLKIVDGGGREINPNESESLAAVAVKNKWDGVYTVTGSFTDLTNAAFAGIYPYTWELQTTGPTQCKVVDNENLGGVGFVFNTGSGLSYYGSFGLLVNFDPATDAISSVVNYYGQPAGNTRSAELDPTGINAYDDATKTINIKYFMIQPSVVPTPPSIRCAWNETWTYSKSR
ncbi:MAG: DUF1735 domain-containing protein [Bacteroidetes bacterium]|nr:DUF1735 domain-containing protein [Bacteroidota bacterium]